MPRARPPRITGVVVTCEHGGNRVPARYRRLFDGRERMLSSHRGWDPGALELARLLARRLRAPLIFATVTRLLVDLNRSADNPALFSSITAPLPDDEKERILAAHYRPYRDKVERTIEGAMRGGGAVLHLSVHTFTPVFRGQRRAADVGLLFDPASDAESAFCDRLLHEFVVTDDGGPRRRPLAVRPNEPYRGTDDGLTTALRTNLPSDRYLGIELEVSQRFPRRGGSAWERVQSRLAASLEAALRAE